MQPDGGNNQKLQQPQGGEDVAPQPQNIPLQQTGTETEPESKFQPVNWEASESISHEHDGPWFIGFISIFLVLGGISVWLQQWTFTILLVIMAIALIVYIRRAPRVLRYSLSGNGLHIDQKFHGFDEFRSFGILQEGELFSIMLMPTKRFGQSLTIYFSESEGEKIVDILGAYLPMEDMHLDIIDTLLRRLRL